MSYNSDHLIRTPQEIFNGTRRHCPSPDIVDRTAEWKCAGWAESSREGESERQLEIAVNNRQERIADYYPENGGIHVFWWRQTDSEPSFTVNQSP
jgi:hypothetical protein